MPSSDRPSPASGPSVERAARDAIMHHVDFLHMVAGDPDAPRGERLQAIELLARLARLGDASTAGGGSAAKGAAKSAAKSSAKHAAKHAEKHASKHASKHAARSAAKGAAKQVGRGEPRRLGQGAEGERKALPGARKALPPGRGD